jgi:hypothetical protein
VIDEPDGWRLEPLIEETPEPPGPDDVPLEQPPTVDVSAHWVCEGWPEDIARAISAFRRHAGGRRIQYVIADVTGQEPARWGTDVEVVPLDAVRGWAAARNAGLRRSRGRLVLILDGSVEPTGDVIAPIEAALVDPSVGVCGPFGIVTEDLRQFEPAPGPGPCDAIEGYLIALRRDTLLVAGMFDEKFRWYRTADIEYSFRVKDTGLRAEVVPVPVERHEHRMWFDTPPADRAKWSKRNFYRFLDRWRDRWDLTIAGEPSDR